MLRKMNGFGLPGIRRADTNYRLICPAGGFYFLRRATDSETIADISRILQRSSKQTVRLRPVQFDYIWQRHYADALVEVDPTLMRHHIAKTREAMDKRLGILAIRKFPLAMAEYRAIEDAEVQLKVLERQIK